jgi:lactoylglutathione lyase
MIPPSNCPEPASNHSGVETRQYLLSHTMLRIKDPQVSLVFYERVLGMKVVKKVDYSEWRFSLYFLATEKAATSLPADPIAVSKWIFNQTGMLELTHNWGTETDDNVRMHNGNDAPQGFGHICIAVPNIEEACDRFERLGVSFQKRLGEGGMREIAFITDPDGYRYEIVEAGLAPKILRDAI